MVSMEATALPILAARALDLREKLSRILLRSSAMLHGAGTVVYLFFEASPIYSAIAAGLRHRDRQGRGHTEASLRCLLHYQAPRAGNRSRAVTDSAGRIELSSEPGKGSRFLLSWPLSQAPRDDKLPSACRRRAAGA